MRDKAFSVAVNSQRWHGFNLCQGHVFGVFHGTAYVSGNVPAGPGFIKVYERIDNINVDRWRTVRVSRYSELGRELAAAHAKNPYGGVKLRPQPKCHEITARDLDWDSCGPIGHVKRRRGGVQTGQIDWSSSNVV